jgi:hypothetical protein
LILSTTLSVQRWKLSGGTRSSTGALRAAVLRGDAFRVEHSAVSDMGALDSTYLHYDDHE